MDQMIEEFLAAGPPARETVCGIDLRTVLSHEMGHLIGLRDESSQDHGVSIVDDEPSVGTLVSPSLYAIDDLFSEID